MCTFLYKEVKEHTIPTVLVISSSFKASNDFLFAETSKRSANLKYGCQEIKAWILPQLLYSIASNLIFYAVCVFSRYVFLRQKLYNVKEQTENKNVSIMWIRPLWNDRPNYQIT